MEPNPNGEKVYQLLYISAANKAFTEAELEDLLRAARSNNTRLGISGMLLFHGGSFIQAVEGDRALVEQLYETIGRDDRHTETRVLYRGHVEKRDFDGWSMGFYRSRQTAAENVSGFHEFLAKGFLSGGDDDGSRARKALVAFREGKWRAKVDL